jgi:hypothetical protein
MTLKAKAEAKLELRRAEVDEAKVEVVEKAKVQEAAKVEVEKAEAKLTAAVPEDDRDRAKRALNIALEGLEIAQAAVKSAQAGVTSAQKLVDACTDSVIAAGGWRPDGVCASRVRFVYLWPPHCTHCCHPFAPLRVSAIR